MKKVVFKAVMGVLLVGAVIACLPRRDHGKLQGTLVKDNILVHEGLTRGYHLYLPKDLPVGNVPLVLLFHGHRGSADQVIGENDKPAPFREWLHIADREKFIVAVPSGERGSDDERGWNDCRTDAGTNPDTDDVGFVRSLIDAIDQRYTIDHGRIYANGISNGGLMVLRLALEAPDLVVAVASVVAAMAADSECSAMNQAVSVLFMNGTADPLVPYEGGQISGKDIGRGTVLSTDASVNYWLGVNDIAMAAQERDFENKSAVDQSTVKSFLYNNDLTNHAVALYKVTGGGHVEPSVKYQFSAVYELLVGKQNHDIEMAEEVWSFVKAKTRDNL